jgi:iron complex outermembrane receptor protein
MIKLTRHLKLGTSTLATLAIAALAPAAAQAPAAPVESVTVTGTSIRGVATVGSNVINVGQQEIKEIGAQTVADVLVNVPSITGMGSAGQGENHTSYYQPTIHQLGSSLSNSTLVLIDSHRAPAGDTNHPVVDPNIIPTLMLERVEVLADGSSSTYGSEAIAGVINFITRKKFDGILFNAQAGFIDGQASKQASFLVGTTGEKSAVLFSYQFSNKGQLLASHRPFTNPDQRARAAANGITGTGNSNFNTFNCDPATLRPNAAGNNYYVNAQGTAQVANSANNAFCNTWNSDVLIEKEVRHALMSKGIHELTPDITLTAEVVYATLARDSLGSPGVLTGTAFGPGSGAARATQLNPFYTNPPGTTGITSQEIRWDSSSVLGPSNVFHKARSVFADVGVEWRINDDWVVNGLANYAHDDSQSGTYNGLNTGVAFLALNRTTNAGGSLTAPSIPGTNTVILNDTLTAANALDVWNPAATNRTSAALRDQLRDSATVIRKMFGIAQFRLTANGTLLNLPAGPVKVAFGFEELDSTLYQTSVGPNGTGPATINSRNYSWLGEHRKDSAGFAEFIFPLISPDMNVPLVQKFDLNLSGRYDHYSDVGNTSNPKIAWNWDVFDGFRLRGNWSTSFVAPALDVPGSAQYPGYYAGNTFQAQTNNSNVSVAAYPLVTQLGIPGCTSASITCNIAAIQGIVNRSGDANVKPIRGRSWSVGFDFTPDFISGLTSQVTYWHTGMLGGITGPNFNNVINSKSMQSLVTFTPNCATPAQIAALQGAIPQSAALPACAQYLFKDPNSNYLNVEIGGIDAAIQYAYPTDTWGDFRFGVAGTQFIQFDEAFGIGAVGDYFDILNTTGANTAFPSVATSMRANLGWSFEDYNVNLFMNYTGAYKNWGNPVNPITLDANLNPAGGGDHVKANVTFDLNLAYTFSTPWTGDNEISLNFRNLFDKEPPFYNATRGYDDWVASPYGRVIQIGFQAKY